MGAGTEDYIKLLQHEADFQSSGRFSLEAKKALQKMQRFRLNNPAEYILQLVSCAVMRGASAIQIEIGGRDLRVGFDGEPFSARELEEIFGYVGQQSQQALTAAGAHLAIALQAMRSYNPDVLLVESRDRHGRNVLQLYEDEVWIETLSGPASTSKAITYVGMEHALSLWNLCFPTLVGSHRAEHHMLRRLAKASPIPVYLNGELVPFLLPSGRALLEGPGQPPVWAGGSFARRIKGPCWGLSYPAQHESRQLVLIQAGICFPQLREPLMDPVVVYLQEDALKRDLSQAEIVKDQLRDELVAAALKVLL